MAYKIKLGTFSKLENSTKQPTTTSWADYDVTLKNGCDLLDPEVTLSVSEATIAPYNYATMFGKYFFIADKYMLRENLCVLQLRHDPLATYKSQIGSSTLYVLRSASTSNGNIFDNLYPTTSISYSRSEDASFVPGGYGLGCYIVNCVGMTTTGGSTLWKFTPNEFRAMLYALYNKIDVFQVSDILDAVSKFLDGSPEKLVSSAMWMPSYNFSGTTKEFYVGTWDTDINATLITDPVFQLPVIELDIPKHPQAATRGSYLNLAPYSTYTLNIPMFGAINIDTTAIKGSTKLYLNIVVDALSGQGRCRVHTGGNPTPLVADLTAQIGVPVPLQGQNTGSTILGGIVSTIAGVATAALNPAHLAAGLIGAGAGAIGTAIHAIDGMSFSTGSSGGALATLYNIVLDATFMNIANEDNTLRGRPLCELKQISTLSGYIMVAEGDVSIPGTITEQREIKTMLESGFFYE